MRLLDRDLATIKARIADAVTRRTPRCSTGMALALSRLRHHHPSISSISSTSPTSPPATTWRRSDERTCTSSAISNGWERLIRLHVEYGSAGCFLESQGTQGSHERLARRRGAGCRGSDFDCYHDRLPPSCYDRATNRGCACHNPTYDSKNDTAERTAEELDTIKHTLGARPDPPISAHLERVWTTYPRPNTP